MCIQGLNCFFCPDTSQSCSDVAIEGVGVEVPNLVGVGVEVPNLVGVGVEVPNLVGVGVEVPNLVGVGVEVPNLGTQEISMSMRD